MTSVVLETHLVTGKYLFAIQIHPLDLIVLQTPPLPEVAQFAAFGLKFSLGVRDGQFLRSLCLPAPLLSDFTSCMLPCSSSGIR